MSDQRRWGGMLACGCWWHAPAGAVAGQTTALCPTHGSALMVRANVEEPDGGELLLGDQFRRPTFPEPPPPPTLLYVGHAMVSIPEGTMSGTLTMRVPGDLLLHRYTATVTEWTEEAP